MLIEGETVNWQFSRIFLWSALGGSPEISPMKTRSSPKENGNGVHMALPRPPRSSGSESSGYFTPPPDNRQAFVKLDTEEHASESEEILPVNDKNNNTSDCVDSFSNNSSNVFIMDNTIVQVSDIKNIIVEFREISDHNANNEVEEVKSVQTAEPENNYPLQRKATPNNRRKEKKQIRRRPPKLLPEISTSRKASSSAPPYNGDTTNNNLMISNVEDIPISPSKAVVPIDQESPSKTVVPVTEIAEIATPQEESSTRKLTRRFTRTQSRRSIKATPRSLNSSEWEVTLQGLQGLSKLSKQHPDAVEAHIHTVCVTLARQIKNLRSQVARSACHTASDLFSNCRKGLDIELEEIAGPLLQRTADTNKFLRADANAALDVMCEQLPVHRVIVVVTARGVTHPNCVVRSAAMRIINDVVKRLGADRIFQMQKEMKDKVLLAGATSLTDGSLETRSYAKAMFSHLVGHHQFHKALVDAVPQNVLRHIAKTLSSIKQNPTT
ncbi:hypothetical protein NQ318_022808 [Aromia moschata]|uniref:TOG domain-containing protein n=1 Tax=Aromia moschata TaxID=1265417 RepID=A0AAV8XPL3_9CUCU|nr:hypothetical protein NQ318_022808 [Aromia moschata]